MSDVAIFISGFVAGAFVAGIAFGGAYVGFVLRAGQHRRPW